MSKMSKVATEVIQKAYDVGFSDEEIREAETKTGTEWMEFIAEVDVREKAIAKATAVGEVELEDNLEEKGKGEEATYIPPSPSKPFMGEVDIAIQQRFDALCLLKGWDSGEKIQEVMEDILGEAGFSRVQ